MCPYNMSRGGHAVCRGHLHGRMTHSWDARTFNLQVQQSPQHENSITHVKHFTSSEGRKDTVLQLLFSAHPRCRCHASTSIFIVRAIDRHVVCQLVCNLDAILLSTTCNAALSSTCCTCGFFVLDCIVTEFTACLSDRRVRVCHTGVGSRMSSPCKNH